MSTPTESPATTSVWTFVSWLPGAVAVTDLVDVLGSTDLGFTPTQVRIKALGEDTVELPWEVALWDRIATTDALTGFHLEGAGEETLGASFRNTGTEVVLTQVEPSAGLLDGLFGLPGLLGGSRGDWDDARWQGEENPNHYRMWFGRPWEHLPRTTDDFGQEIIDVSGNPGRITDVPGMRLWAGQDVWLAPASRLLVSYDDAPNLPVGTITEERDGIVHIRLWEDGTSLEEIRSRQQVLRDRLGYDEAVAREDEIWDELTAGQPDDPMIALVRGSFPHGGDRLVLQYFSTSKRPTTRSRAAWLVVQEFRGSGEPLDEETYDLTTQPHPDLG